MESDLRSAVAKVLGLAPEQISDDLERGKTESWDSLNHLLLVSEIESELGVEFTTEEVLEMKTFKDVREIVDSKRKKRNG